MAFLNLVDCIGIVVPASVQHSVFVKELDMYSRGHWNVTTVDHGGPVVEWVCSKRHVVSAAEAHLS